LPGAATVYGANNRRQLYYHGNGAEDNKKVSLRKNEHVIVFARDDLFFP